jgi:L-lactate permease
MLKNKSILQSISFLFLLLVLNASFFAVFTPKNEATISKKTEQNNDNVNKDTNNSQSEHASYSEGLPFDAVINLGLQCEFHKIVFVEIPQFFISFPILSKEVIKQTFQSVFLLSYFQNLFKTSILINAP